VITSCNISKLVIADSKLSLANLFRSSIDYSLRCENVPSMA